MALRDMIGDMLGRVPKLSAQLARTLVNEALSKIYSENDWSFNLVEGGWLTQNLVSDGTITAKIGSNQIIGDVIAVAAWNAVGFDITQMQIRLPAYALYSVVAYSAPVLTIDRPWMEPDGAFLEYFMYQAYYPAPVPDMRRWLTIRDTTNAASLDFSSFKQTDLATADPQRTIFQNPSCVVPYKVDSRPGSATMGYMLYEMYPQPLQELPYALFAVREGAPLVNPQDTLPYPLTEELVRARARMLAYEWAESQMGQETHRGSQADYRFLMGAAEALYRERIQDVRKIDRNLSDQFIASLNRCKGAAYGGPFFSPLTGTVNIGTF
jgi:hypothetical protein